MLNRKSFQTVLFSLGLIFAVYALGTAISFTAQKPINKQLAPVGVPGVQISVVNKATPNAKPLSSVTANSDGGFDMGVLPAGTYSLVVNPPASTNAQAKSFFESRSNMRVEVTVKDPKRAATDPFIVDFVLKDGALARAKADHNMSKSIIQNIKAREAVPKENEITIDVAKGQSVSGRITSIIEKSPSK